jgi:hypothetical protein
MIEDHGAVLAVDRGGQAADRAVGTRRSNARAREIEDRRRRLVVAGFPATASVDVDQDLADRAGFGRGMGVGGLLERKAVER